MPRYTSYWVSQGSHLADTLFFPSLSNSNRLNLFLVTVPCGDALPTMTKLDALFGVLLIGVIVSSRHGFLHLLSTSSNPISSHTYALMCRSVCPNSSAAVVSVLHSHGIHIYKPHKS